MRIRDIMSTEVKVVAPSAWAREAIDLMEAEHIHHLVVANGRTVLGVLAARELWASEGKQVGELMNARPITAEPNMLVKKAANLLRGRSIGCLPVVENGRLVGIVTLSD